MELLIQYNADVMRTDTDQKSALHIAAEWGHLDAVKYLVDMGVPLCKDLNGYSPVDYANENDQIEISDFLVQSEANNEMRSVKASAVTTQRSARDVSDQNLN